MNILSLAKQNEELLIYIRRKLHQIPELPKQEFKTLAFIKEKLTEFGINYIEIEDGGVLAFIGKTNGKTVLLRADIDALPMQELPNNMKEQKACPISKNNGIAHMCGHDAHTAMLLVSGKILQENMDQLDGRVILLFERGEEGSDCMKYILRYLEKENVRIDGCHALHVSPTYPAGKIAAKYGEVLAGSIGFDVVLNGKGGHGSRPDLSNSPLDCFNAICFDLNTVRMKNISPLHTMTLSIGEVHYGTNWNIIAPQLNFVGGGRYFDREGAGIILRNRLIDIVKKNAEIYGCTYTFNRLQGPSFGVVNNKECVDVARTAIDKYLGRDVLIEIEPEFASESMAMMMQRYPGVYCMLGVGNSEKGITSNPHNPMFDIDESALHFGVVSNIAYTLEFLNSDYKPEFKSFEGTGEEIYSAHRGIGFEHP
ncbi:M20 family metallopeptidase [Clostridioides sp. ES-S-0048-02]|uniref:M20 metallopeptidase family protein n=1 Tax=Clostridioides sp. ES-S-0048-02 TaxID=2770777 RepID=UPI001D11F549|nr:amidohydrolase [Clostridioides sp. ES-S-0048-02]